MKQKKVLFGFTFGFVVLSFIFSDASCRKSRPHNMMLLPLSTINSSVILDFAEESALSETSPHLTSTSPNQNSNHLILPSLATEGEPALVPSSKGELCIASHRSEIFILEAGLRFAWCHPLIGENVYEIQTLLHRLKDHRKPTAYDEFHKAPLHIYVRTKAQIRDRFAPVRISVDGSINGESLFDYKTLRGNLLHLHHQGGSFNNPSLPRRFPLSGYHLLVNENSIVLLYPLPDDHNRMIVIEIHDPHSVNKIQDALLNVPKKVASLIQEASSKSTGTLYVSEIYFRKQSGAGKEYIELAGDDFQNKIYRGTTTADNEASVPFEYYLFSASTLILFEDKAGKALFKDTFVLNNQNGTEQEYKSSWSALHQASPLRAFVKEFSSNGELEQSKFCYGRQPCGSKGVHPSKVHSPVQTASDDLRLCKVDDFEMSELNPFGILPNRKDELSPTNTLDSNGKFIELKAKRDCRLESILLLSGSAVIDMQERDVVKESYILLAASEKYFLTLDYKESDLRSLSANSVISLVDIKNLTQRTLQNPPIDLVYVYGDRSANNISTKRARVHSLVPSDMCGMALSPYPSYHSVKSKNLRPDIEPFHAMSPGTSGESECKSNSSLKLSELLPQGSISPSGNTLPDEEFVEFFNDEEDTLASGAVLLRVVKKSDGKVYQYLLSPSVYSGNAEQKRYILQRKESICFTNDEDRQTLFSDLSLPNGASSYTLIDGITLQTLDTKTIDEATFSLMESHTMRKSLTYFFKTNHWAVSTHGMPTSCKVTATPAEEEE